MISAQNFVKRVSVLGATTVLSMSGLVGMASAHSSSYSSEHEQLNNPQYKQYPSRQL
jgi:hypothetical protein